MRWFRTSFHAYAKDCQLRALPRRYFLSRVNRRSGQHLLDIRFAKTMGFRSIATRLNMLAEPVQHL